MPSPIPPPPQPPARYCPSLRFPPYRYVPGLQPHPLVHKDGHRCLGVPPIEPWHPGLPLGQDTAWLGGLDLFNHRYWWESHELWEQRWHQVAKEHPTRALLQSCIQLAAALLKHHLGDARSAQRLAERTLHRLAALHLAHPGHGGLHLPTLGQALRAHLAANGPPPTLTVG